MRGMTSRQQFLCMPAYARSDHLQVVYYALPVELQVHAIVSAPPAQRSPRPRQETPCPRATLFLQPVA